MKFFIESLSQTIITAMKDTKVWTNECPVPLTELKLINVQHYNFDQQIKLGQIIVHDQIAQHTLNIFKKLFELQFPIHSIIPIHEFGGDDNKSMAENNSSCFNFRKIEGTDMLSMHSYGLAIDINPLQNPYIIIKDDKSVEVHPKMGVDYLNRGNLRPGMVEPIIHIFAENGIPEWGGNWNTPIDYHHFQMLRSSVNTNLI